MTAWQDEAPIIQLPLTEGERQVVVLALAELALSRPGWDDMISVIVRKIDNPGLPMYHEFKRINADRVRSSHQDLSGKPLDSQ